jgi:phosphate:Na+ symporter
MILPYLVKLSIWLTPKREKEPVMEELHHIKYLNTKFVDTPSIAMAQARAEILRMGKAVETMFDNVMNSFKERKIKELSKWKKHEDALDILQKEITQFLVKVMQRNIMPEESKEVTSLMRMTNNFERTGDSIENIAQLMEELIEQNLYFSEGGMNDFDTIATEVRKFINFVLASVQEDNKEVMHEAEILEESINQMTVEMKDNHIMRLQSGACTVDPGLILIDMLTAFEKMGDFCFNIAQAVAGVK